MRAGGALVATLVVLVHATDYKFTLEAKKTKFPGKHGSSDVDLTMNVFAWGQVKGNELTFDQFSMVLEGAAAADVLTTPGSMPKQHVTYVRVVPLGSAKTFVHFLAMETSWNRNSGGTVERFLEDGGHSLLRANDGGFTRVKSRQVSMPEMEISGRRPDKFYEKYDDESVQWSPAEGTVEIEVTEGGSSEESSELLAYRFEEEAAEAPTAFTMSLSLPKAKAFEWGSKGTWSIPGHKIEVSGTTTLDKIYVKKSIDVQPIKLKFVKKGNEVTGAGDAVFKPKTIAAWKRAGLTVNWLPPITFDITTTALTTKHYPSTVSSAEAQNLFFVIDKQLKSTLCTTCIKVLYLKDLLCCGGGFSYGGGGIGYVAMNSREAYCDDNTPPAAGKGDLAAAHELGHQFALFHPWDGSNSYGTTTAYNTLMCGSGFRRNNPSNIASNYRDIIRNPGFMGALTTVALPAGDCDESDPANKCTVSASTCTLTGLECGPETYKIHFANAAPSTTVNTYDLAVTNAADKKLVAHVKHFISTWYKHASDPFFVCVIGHASTVGNGAKNKALSQKRAEMVYAELGLNAARYKDCPKPPLPNVNCFKDPAKPGLHWCGSNHATSSSSWRRADVIVFRS